MKRWLLLIGLLLLSIPVYAEDKFEGYVFANAPFQYESWTWANGQWHVDKGVWSGIRVNIPLMEGHTLKVAEGLIWDSSPDGITKKPNTLGIGPVGTCLDIQLQLQPITKEATLSLEYTLKNWWVSDESYGYEYMVCPNAVVQNLRAVVEWRLF